MDPRHPSGDHDVRPTDDQPPLRDQASRVPDVFIRTFWFAHRAVYRLTRGSLGLWRPPQGKLGRDAPRHDRPEERPAAHRDPRLLRGRPEPRHDGDERLAGARPGVVAQPPGEPGGDRRARRRAAHGPRPGWPRATSAPASGRSCASSTATSTPTPPSGRTRRPWSSWSRSARLPETRSAAGVV